jgi:hypothetical protein
MTRVLLLLITALVIAAASCSHHTSHGASTLPKPATSVQTLPPGIDPPKPPVRPAGSWAGVLNAANERTGALMGPTLSVAVTITEAGPKYIGDCSQSGSAVTVTTIDREMIEGFRLIGIDPAGDVVMMEGHCGKLRFTLAYHPVNDRIWVDWAEHHYFGEMKRR